MTEDQVIKALRRELPSKGHEILGYTTGNQPGWDVGTRYKGSLCAIEAKGITEKTLHENQTAGSELAWDSGFARLVQIAAGRKYLYRVDPVRGRYRTHWHRPTYVVLAVPDSAAFRGQFRWFKKHMKAAGFGAWFIAKNGTIDPVLNPRPIR